MTVKHFTFSLFQTNCYVCHDAGEAVIIDPSCQTAREQQTVIDYIEAQGVVVKHLLLTHAHIDHIFGCADLAGHYGMAWQMHRDDVEFLRRAEAQGQAFGVPLTPPPPPGRFLDAGDTVSFGGASWEVLHTPGHSPGSICFYDAQNSFVVSGDVLFMNSIGRTEGLPRTSLPQLMESIFQTLLPLPDDTTVYPGHGPATTIGRERTANPFLLGAF